MAIQDGDAANGGSRIVQSKKVWASLITNLAYLPGLLTLDFNLKQYKSAYPLVALYTDGFPEEGRSALKKRGIPMKNVKQLLPSIEIDYGADVRFQDTWSKLGLFALTEFDRVVQLDSDMLLRQNIDELMDLELDDAAAGGHGQRVFAASHACTCNPFKRPHYPANWIPENCAFTSQHSDPESAQTSGAPSLTGLSNLNSGLLVVNPSEEAYDQVIAALGTEKTRSYQFPDQDLLADVFHGRWVPLPYIYNALRPMRFPNVHGAIWRDEKVKVVHYIVTPKPWNEAPGTETDETFKWWWDANFRRLADEKKRGIVDE